MAQSLSNILLHIVFSTKDRRPLIPLDLEPRLYQYISGICDNLGCPVIYIGGMSDHTHILLSLGRTIPVSELISKIKANSSRWVKSIDAVHSSFAWQGGYGAFSIGESSRQQAINYIANQKAHHTTITFQEEFLLLLNKYRISVDEKYLWD